MNWQAHNKKYINKVSCIKYSYLIMIQRHFYPCLLPKTKVLNIIDSKTFASQMSSDATLRYKHQR